MKDESKLVLKNYEVALPHAYKLFVDKMNFYAQKIGMRDTHFANSHGLNNLITYKSIINFTKKNYFKGLTNKDNYSTAYDLALLSCICLKNEFI